MLEAFQKCFENTVLGSKIRFSALMSNNAKKNHETLRKHELNMFWGFLRIFWKSGSRLKNPVLGSDVEQFLETPRKHQQNMFWGFLRNSWKSGSRLKNAVLGSKIRFSAQMSNNAQILWNTQKTPTKHALRHLKKFLKTCFEAFWEILENPVLDSKMRFSAQISNYAKIPWNTQKTPTKHVLRLFKKFWKIRLSAQKSGSRLRCRTMLKYYETLRKHQLNTLWGTSRNFWKFDSWLKNPVLGSDVE